MIFTSLEIYTDFQTKPDDAFLEKNKDNPLKVLFCFMPYAGIYSCTLYTIAFRTCFSKFIPLPPAPIDESIINILKPAYFFIASAWHAAENALCFCLQNKFPTNTPSTATNVSYRDAISSSRVTQSNSSPVPQVNSPPVNTAIESNSATNTQVNSITPPQSIKGLKGYWTNPTQKVLNNPIRALIDSVALKVIAWLASYISPVIGSAIFIISISLIDRIAILNFRDFSKMITTKLKATSSKIINVIKRSFWG